MIIRKYEWNPLLTHEQNLRAKERWDIEHDVSLLKLPLEIIGVLFILLVGIIFSIPYKKVFKWSVVGFIMFVVGIYTYRAIEYPFEIQKDAESYAESCDKYPLTYKQPCRTVEEIKADLYESRSIWEYIARGY